MRLARGEELPVRCEVKSISFASHVDSAGILRLLRQCQPRSVVLVHGEKNKMVRFFPFVFVFVCGRLVYFVFVCEKGDGWTINT